jgi:hypothetical protein
MNKVIHFEIPFDNEERATKFYTDVFGWQLNKLPEMDYCFAITVPVDEKTMIPKESGAINGGMMKRHPTGEHPVVVIDVPSVDDYVQKVEAAGGNVVMQKMSIGEFGFYARVSDTEGNIIGIWQNRK